MEFKIDSVLKQEYLDAKPESTAKAESFVLRAADEYEALIGKSIYDMSYAELKEMFLMQFKNSSEGAIRKNVSVLKKFIDFCIERNVVTHGENRLATFTSKEARKFVNQQALLKKYISRQKLREYQDICYNEQDKAILELAFLGVGGKGQEEIINLTIDDVDEENKMLVLTTDEGKKRLLAVDLSTIGLIKQAYEQETYVENNGKKTNNIRISEPRKMQINKVGNYVFRVPGQSKYEKFTVNLLGSRMNRYKQWFDNPYLTYTSLRDSGIIQTTMDIYEEKGEVTKEDYMDICDRFNYGTESSEGYWNVAKTMFEQYKEMLNNNNK